MKLRRRPSNKVIANGLVLLGGAICLSRAHSSLGTKVAMAYLLSKLAKRGASYKKEGNLPSRKDLNSWWICRCMMMWFNYLLQMQLGSSMCCKYRCSWSSEVLSSLVVLDVGRKWGIQEKIITCSFWYSRLANTTPSASILTFQKFHYTLLIFASLQMIWIVICCTYLKMLDQKLLIWDPLAFLIKWWQETTCIQMISPVDHTL